ncbi:MAG: cupin domain-containing protein [Halioglobus sp.]|nr:cupin domain-containing protein [Halioglobus sp.]
MKANISIYDPAGEYFFEEGCFINELSNSDADPAVSIAQARVAPGQKTRWHLLQGITERYVLLRGSGIVEVDGLEPRGVGPGDVVTIPPGARQRISNPGAEDLVFLAVCTPRFTPQAYVDVQE